MGGTGSLALNSYNYCSIVKEALQDICIREVTSKSYFVKYITDGYYVSRLEESFFEVKEDKV